MIFCGSCHMAMRWNAEIRAWVHDCHGDKDVLAALRCPAFGAGITQPYRVDSPDMRHLWPVEFRQDWWDREWRRLWAT